MLVSSRTFFLITAEKKGRCPGGWDLEDSPSLIFAASGIDVVQAG